MTSRLSRIAWYIWIAVLIGGDISYRMVIQDLSDLAHARVPQTVWGLGAAAIVLLGCAGYVAATSVWPRRDPADHQALGVTSVVVLVALFVFSNTAPGGPVIPGGVFFALQALLWSVAGTLVLLGLRNQRSAGASVLRVYAVVFVAGQGVVGVLGASYAGDVTMTYAAAAVVVGGTLATLALTLRDWGLAQRETEASSAPRR